MFTWLTKLFKADTKTIPHISFVLTDPEKLDYLRVRGGHDSNRDLLNSALTVYEWALDALDEGRIIASVNEIQDSYRELSIPSFEMIKEKTPWGTWQTEFEDLDDIPDEDETS